MLLLTGNLVLAFWSRFCSSGLKKLDEDCNRYFTMVFFVCIVLAVSISHDHFTSVALVAPAAV